MKAAVERAGGPFTIFGGEPLLVPLSDLEELWAWGYQRWGRNGIQTNGALITEAHIELFRKYNVHVGVSIDGPGAMNDLRVAGDQENTRTTTAFIERMIQRLCSERLSTSVIITLHRLNASPERLPRMHAWVRELQDIGVKSARIHTLEVDNAVAARFALTEEDNIMAFLSFAELEQQLTTLKLDVFSDIKDELLGRDDRTTCVWNACDPYTTRAVNGIEGNGKRSNCGRTNKDGIDFEKADRPGFERYLALYYAPQTCGGCSGCRFFLMCKGQCPGTAIDGDWRNRTEYCALWKRLFMECEDRLIRSGVQPISDNVPLRLALERMLVEAWNRGDNPSLSSLIRRIHAPASRHSQKREAI
jgi:uncharacterized protein